MKLHRSGDTKDEKLTNAPAAAGAGGTHDLLSATHDDTSASAVTKGSILKGNAAPAWAELAVGTAGQQLTVNEAADDLEYGLASKYLEVRHGVGGTLAEGTPVYMTGWNVGGWITVEAADAAAAGTMPAVGLVFESAGITSAADGRVLIMGNFTGLDTSAFVVDAAVYVASGGGLTSTKPTGTALIQKVGTVGRSHASSGQLIVQGAGRSNDLPNLPDENLWQGNGSAVPTASPDLNLGSGHAHFGTIINNTGAAPLIDLTLGNIQKLTLSVNTVPTVTDPTGIGTINILVIQAGTAYTVDWSNFPVTWTDAEGEPDLSTVSKKYIVTLLFDGTNYFGNFKGPFT